jgi:hypothetical protein
MRLKLAAYVAPGNDPGKRKHFFFEKKQQEIFTNCAQPAVQKGQFR